MSNELSAKGTLTTESCIRTEEGTLQVEPVVFGRLADAGLREILRGDARRRFTAPFAERLAAEERFRTAAAGLWGGEALARLEEADLRREEELAARPLPPPCAACHKALGW